MAQHFFPPKWMSGRLQKSLQKDQQLRNHAKLHSSSKIKSRKTKKWEYHHQNLKIEIKKARVDFETKEVMKIPKDSQIFFNRVKRAKIVNMSSPINDINIMAKF